MPQPSPQPSAYLYTMPGCHSCIMAKRYLEENKIEYTEISIDNPLLVRGVLAVVKEVFAPLIVMGDQVYAMTTDGQPIRLKDKEAA